MIENLIYGSIEYLFYIKMEKTKKISIIIILSVKKIITIEDKNGG